VTQKQSLYFTLTQDKHNTGYTIKSQGKKEKHHFTAFYVTVHVSHNSYFYSLTSSDIAISQITT